jgi:basic membrane protein A
VLTSALKKVDEGVFRTIRSVQDGTWQGGRNLTFGLAEDGVGLGTISRRVPEGDLGKLEDVRERIAAGEIEVPRELG